MTNRWDDVIRDKNDLVRELNDNECAAMKKIFAGFIHKVKDGLLEVSGESPAFDDRVADFFEFAVFDEVLLADAKKTPLAVFFENQCKPSLLVCKTGLLFNDPAWLLLPEETNISYIPWSLFAKFSGERCSQNGIMDLMQDELYTKSPDVLGHARDLFDFATRQWGCLSHAFNFGELGIPSGIVDEMFAEVKRVLSESMEGLPSTDEMSQGSDVCDNPPSIEDAPPSIEDAPPSIDDEPPSIEDAPPSIEDAPPSIDDEPPSIDDAQPSIEDAPPSIEDADDVPPPSVELDDE